jgi:hypothetical protein
MEEIMNHDNLVLDAIEAVSHLEVPEEDLAVVLTAQARYMSGISNDADWCPDDEIPIH